MKITKGKGILIPLIILGTTIVAFVGVLLFLISNYKTTSYYVLNTDVPTRTQITPDMLEKVVVSDGGQPGNAIDLADVQQGGIYTQFPLNKGDVLSPSNVGGYEDISVGVPDEWVITNFAVSADNAVQGRIRRGTYFDILVVSNDGGAFYPFVNVLALDATVSLNGASSAVAVDTDEAYKGQTSQYTVGMSPEDAAKLHDLLKRQPDVKLVLSPRQNEYAKPELNKYTGLFKYDADSAEDMPIKPKNMGEDTDYTFSTVERDEFGRPVAKVATCGDGNAKITGDACDNKLKATAKDSKDAKDSAENQETPQELKAPSDDSKEDKE